MEATADEAYEQIVAARQQVRSELDVMRTTTRDAVDIPAKIRKDPVKALGLIGGAGFLAVGGPKRLLKMAGGRVRPPRKDQLKGILPKEVEKVIDKTADDPEKVRRSLEEGFYSYLTKTQPKQPPPNASQSFWKTYDTIVGPLGAIGARTLAQRLFAPPRSSGATPTVPPAQAAPSSPVKPTTGGRSSG